ncbi:mersacidin family lantibiotic [Paenibacillus profundus]|uniref:Mersacidin family lantibiotic n=1 Tax=Paenibacillus profundus TaxID=1173085 RepID=A0ABS8YRF8_9BACL|nr:mersacidin family lantibiotic [Paenibacillus profundus]MCE5173033.1 mersacidin family lantibiotic [Paenibacillus profundus]
MTNEQIIAAWKNPELRADMQLPPHPSGRGFQELSFEEMMGIHGAAEVGTNATPTISAVVISAIRTSSKVCIGLSAGAISGIISRRKTCLG